MKSWRDGLYLIRRFGDGVLGLDPVPERPPRVHDSGPTIPGDKGQPVPVPSLRSGYRGINVVQDGPAEGVPEPGGLPGAEPSIVHDPAQNVRVPGPVGRNPRRCTDGFLGHVWDSMNADSARCLICRVPWSPERAYSWQVPSGDRRDYGVDAAGEERKPVQAERPAGVYR